MSTIAKLKSPIVTSSTAPNVRTSEEKLENSDADLSLISQKKPINLVASALNPSPPLENSDPMVSDSNGVESDEESTGEEDSEMSQYDEECTGEEDSEIYEYEEPEENEELEENDELEDSMTLIQYQSGLRREALARKGPQSSEASHKKESLDAERMVVQ